MSESYRIETDRGKESILCLRCGARSSHPKDIEHAYCGVCRLFHRPELELEPERSDRLRRAYERGDLLRQPMAYLGPPAVDKIARVLHGECELCGRFVACWMPLSIAVQGLDAGRLVYRCGRDCPGESV